MRLLSVFVLAVVTAGGVKSVAEEPLIMLQDTASDLLTPGKIKQAGNGNDAAVMMANSDSELVADAGCSPSLNQRRGRGKIRRGNICSPDGQPRASPPKGQQEVNDEQPIVPYQMAPAEETPGDSSAASGDSSNDPKLACNPLLVGLNRQVAVCDTGKALNRILNINIRMPTVWPIGTTYPGGSYTIEDITFCKSHHIVAGEVWTCSKSEVKGPPQAVADLRSCGAALRRSR